MNTIRAFLHGVLIALALGAAAARSQDVAAGPLAPIAHWVGGQWVATFKTAKGEESRTIRAYEWSFDRRVIIARSFGERDGKRVQTRFTLFVWNPEAQRIEFTDVIEQGGHGSGFVEPRDGGLFMQARIVGNDKNLAWRAWIMREADGAESFRIDAEEKGGWKPFGTWVYRGEP